MFKKKDADYPIPHSLFWASSILVFHVVLFACLGLLVLFFRGIIDYIVWILLGGGAFLAGSAYLFFRYMKKQGGETLHRVLSRPEFAGKNLEISFLGGLASFKIADQGPRLAGIDTRSVPACRQLEDPETIRIKELTDLARLLEKDLITAEEYCRAKNALVGKEWPPGNPS